MKTRLLIVLATLILALPFTAMASEGAADAPAADLDALLAELAPPAPNQSFECHPEDPHCPADDNDPKCHPEDIACYCPTNSTMCLRLRYCILGCINQGYTGGYLDAKQNCICTGGPST